MPGSTSKPRTCSLCRQRKIRCDGESPCERCKNSRTAVTCTYGGKRVVPPRSGWLPKGAACQRCREHKRRCNGAQPCLTCTKARPPSECHYGEPSPAQSNPAEADSSENSTAESTALSNLQDPSSSSSSEYWSPFCAADAELDLSAFPSTESCLFDSPYEQIPTYFGLDFMNAIAPAALPSVVGDSTVLVSGEGIIYDPNAYGDLVPPRDTHSIVLPPPRVSLSPASQLTTGDTSALFKIRNRFLSHGWQYGLSISTAKWNAVSRGDQSGVVVHPTLVNVCQLMGCLLTVHLQDRTWVYHTGQTIVEEEQVSLILGSLTSGPGIAPDPLTALQAHVHLATYFIQKGYVNTFDAFVWKAGELIAQNEAALGLNEDDVPPATHDIVVDAEYFSPRGPEAEALAAFAQLMFIDILRSLVLRLPSVLNTVLFGKFSRMARQNRTCTDPVFLRAKSALFLVEGQHLVTAWNKFKSSTVFPTEWSRNYWSLLDDIRAHLKLINTCWTRVYLIPELQMVSPTLKTSMILALTAMVELFGLLAPFLPESRRHHREAVNTIVGITSTFSAADYEFLDPALAVCWSIACRPVGEADTEANTGVTDGASEIRSDIIRRSNTMLRQAMPFVIKI
ncbi:hypothetical protein C8J57DRAFT_1478580 [Mycena rebaudengoi]|nr:hypothetical protein C8J57DRAFT_1478580 [Mycena rebaudengoi]